MAIKENPVLTKEDFEAALVSRRLSVSQVARDANIPRHVVSHFRNYGDGMKPEQLARLRGYLEALGVEFDDEASPTVNAIPPNSLRLPSILSDDGLTQRTALVCRHFFIDERITEEQISEASQRIEENFSKAKELLGIDLGRDWISGSFDEATSEKLRELWGHLASIGLVSLHLQGRILINQERIMSNLLLGEDKPKPVTFGDLLSDTYSELISSLNHPETDQEEEELETDEETTS